MVGRWTSNGENETMRKATANTTFHLMEKEEIKLNSGKRINTRQSPEGNPYHYLLDNPWPPLVLFSHRHLVGAGLGQAPHA
jgi:hypothetical protein